jgi:hypothetical protein
MSRSIDELIDRSNHAWPTVMRWVSAASRPVTVLPANPGGRQTLEALQVTTRSPMGALALESGGLIIDDGWLRLLGGSEPERIGLRTWNGLLPDSEPLVPGALVVAIDVVGGLFAINDVAFPDGRGHVWYFGPDTLTWLDTGMGYSELVKWSVGGDLDGFYSDLRWPRWRDQTRPLTIDQGISIYPFPWATDAGPLGSRQRRVVPITELAYIYLDTKRQLEATNQQGPVRIAFDDE